MYAPLRDSIGRIIGTPDGKANNLVNLVAGAAVGAVGAFWSSPLFLVKTVGHCIVVLMNSGDQDLTAE